MRKSCLKNKYLQSLLKLPRGFVKDIVQLQGKYFIYVLLKKNLCLDLKFEHTDLIKRNSDSFQSRWRTHTSSSLYQKVNLWYMK